MIDIPVERLGTADFSVLAARHPDRQAAIYRAGRKRLTAPGLALMEARSRAWSVRSGNPYHAEIDAIARAAPAPGTWFMNFCYEWGCTAGLMPTGGAPTLLKTLDWPFDRIGESVVVAERDGGAGPYWAVTWPGFAGLITLMAPGRFAATINQAPMRRRSPLVAVDWLLDRLSVRRSGALPAPHLLRKVADEAPDFAAAKEMLARSEIALPAIYVLAGQTPAEAVILERTETDCHARDGHHAAANHWSGFTMPHRARGVESPRREADMAALARDGTSAPHGFEWLTPPIRNRLTRVATVLDQANGRLSVLGLEREAPATRPLHLDTSPAGQAPLAATHLQDG